MKSINEYDKNTSKGNKIRNSLVVKSSSINTPIIDKSTICIKPDVNHENKVMNAESTTDTFKAITE